MERFKHTPGPWIINKNHPNPIIIEIKAGGEDNWASFTLTNANNGDTQIANAKLIAAAPDLLEALIDLAIAVTSGKARMENDIDKAKTAIKKATGEIEL